MNKVNESKKQKFIIRSILGFKKLYLKLRDFETLFPFINHKLFAFLGNQHFQSKS